MQMLRENYYPDAPLPIRQLSSPEVVRTGLPQFGGLASKLLTLFGNVRYFRKFDALVVPERTTLMLRRVLPRRTRLIWTRHGAGDRAVGFKRDVAHFDFILMAGQKIEQRLRKQGALKPGRYATDVYAKFDLARRMSHPPLFENGRPTVLYNPHFWPNLSSWPVWGRKVLNFFARSERFNLIFAPHIRLFHRAAPGISDDFAKYQKRPNIHVDLGSEASVNMAYTEGADLYLGDVSSQVAEFMIRPRPAVFLNAHDVSWRDNPDYHFWSLGPVIDDVNELENALDAAIAEHPAWQARQYEYRRQTFGKVEGDTAPRGADAIIDFLKAA
ncbi:MAG: hypothetical protein AB7E05_01920 [Sphingobium sp.]